MLCILRQKILLHTSRGRYELLLLLLLLYFVGAVVLCRAGVGHLRETILAALRCRLLPHTLCAAGRLSAAAAAAAAAAQFLCIC
jgi:hypothetical protein